MDKFELEKRTKRFALKIIAFAATLPQSKAGGIIEYQLVKAGTSVGANYREANQHRAERKGESRSRVTKLNEIRNSKFFWS